MRVRMISLVALFVLAACTESSTNPGARTSVYLTDSPFPFNNVQSVNVRIVRLEATKSLDTIGTSGQQWTLIGEPNRTVDLLELQGGVTTLVAETDLPAGDYRAVRMTIDPSLSSVVNKDGQPIPVFWGDTGPFTMYAAVEDPLPISGSGGRIVIDFDVGRSFRTVGNGLLFIPWLRAVNEDRTGSIAGTIKLGSTTALADAVVSAFRNGVLVGTARTGVDGRYRVAYLPAGSYRVVIEAPVPVGATSAPCNELDGIEVSAGKSSNLDYFLQETGGCTLDINPDSSSSGGLPTEPVWSVAITLDSPHSSVAVDDSLGFSAQLRDFGGVALYGRQVSWTTSSPDVVSIDWSYGSFAIGRAHKAGSANITATSEGKSASLTVSVH